MKRIAALLATALVLTGCSGDQSDGLEPSDKAEATVAAPARAEYSLLTKGQLKAAVLKVSDMPTGYGEDPESDASDKNTKTYCDYKRPFEPSADALQSFLKGSGLSSEFVQISLRQYGDSNEGAASFKALVDTMDTCKKDSIDGDPVKFSILSTPDLEDGSIGISTSSDDVSVPQFFVLAGPTLISVGGGGLLGSDVDALLELLKKQIGSYKDAAKK